MGRVPTLVAAGIGCLVALTGAQQPAPVEAPGPAGPQTTFQAGVDVIELEVSVLDKTRRPVRGLTAADFTVLENGKPQRIVATAEVDAVENDPNPSAWMRHVPRDVTANDLPDQIGDGRLVAIVMDDVNTPFDSVEITMAARAAGRHVIDDLGPSDVAAVVFARDAGKTQDFTDDRAKLIEAIDRFIPREPERIEPTPMGAGPIGGDIRRSSPVLMRSACLRSQLIVPTLETVTSQLATVPKRRKTIVLVSTGVPVVFGDTQSPCASEKTEVMKDVFRTAQRADVNIYSIDPSGFRGYETYLADKMSIRPGRGGGRNPQGAASNNAHLRHEFLKDTADYTGGRAVVDSDDIDSAIDQIFEEDGSYYLVGYQTSNANPDGKFRRVEVKVNRPGLTARTRSGYWAPAGKFSTAARTEANPSTNDLNMLGMMADPGLPLRVSVVPVARVDPSGANRAAEIAVVLTVRVPVPRAVLPETVTVVRNVYDTDGRPGPPNREVATMALKPGTGDALRYDVLSRFALAPGRYQVRLNVHSALIDTSGSVYADVEVPDFARADLAASGIELGAKVPDDSPRTDVLAAILPIVPTSARDFASSEPVVVFLRVFQGGASPPVAATLSTKILDIRDAVVFETTAMLAPERFDATRAAGYQLDLPLARLSRGPHLLSITASLPGGRSVRRDMVFRVR